MIDISNIRNFVVQKYPKIGHPKKEEMTRLFFEILKRESVSLDQIVLGYNKDLTDYRGFRAYLVKRRFPGLSSEMSKVPLRFPKLDIDEGHAIEIKKQSLVLKNVYVEKKVISSALVARLRRKFPQANFIEIDRYKTFIKDRPYGIKEYNRRTDSFFITHEEYDFYKRCPCSTKSVFCGYHVVNLGSGCAFECAYCYLQDYVNSPGIVLPANIEDFFDKFREYRQDVRVGSGELTDSLIFDHLTEFSVQIVDFFRGYPKSSFEFKTKSNNISLLTSIKGTENVVISWSMNPQFIIQETEHYTANLNERLNAAKECAEAGYKVAFHFDPIIVYAHWRQDYQDLIRQIFSQIPKSKIAWLSIGTLRMTLGLKRIIENRFPDNFILNDEFLVGHDGKLRYSNRVRAQIYQSMKKWITAYSPETIVYLCMEEKTMCEQTQSAPLKKYRLEGYPA
ncbi:MAG: hypothetical protein KC713_06565 [Candidatus Omnitrophica bacterium]|nr:hypothetical protein [Candidatus Omnitrophota bacterium]